MFPLNNCHLWSLIIFLRGWLLNKITVSKVREKKKKERYTVAWCVRMLCLLNIFLLEKIYSLHFITQQKLEELKKQLEEKKAVVENLKGTDIFE